MSPPANAPAQPAVGGQASNKATVRTLAVLSQFVRSPGTKGVTELSRDLGMTKSMVYRALSTLAEQNLLVRDPTGSRYMLGPGVLELNPVDAAEPELSELVGPYLRRLHDLTGETISLNVPIGRQVLTIDGTEGRGRVSRRVPIGRLVPQHANASGRAILAFRSDAEISRYLTAPLERFTDTTLTTPSEIWEEVGLVRERGYALGYGDHVPQARGIAFPVLDCDNRPLGSVTLSGPAGRVTAEWIEDQLPTLEDVAQQWNRRSRLLRRPIGSDHASQ